MLRSGDHADILFAVSSVVNSVDSADSINSNVLLAWPDADGVTSATGEAADEVRADPSAAGAVAASRLNMPTWVHLNVNVLDQEEFPATDYLLPGGLTLEELREALMGIFAGGRVVGFSLGCYNPDKDPDGRCGQRLVTCW